MLGWWASMLRRAVSGAGCGDRRASIGPGTSGDLLGRRGAAGACWPIVSSIDVLSVLSFHQFRTLCGTLPLDAGLRHINSGLIPCVSCARTRKTGTSLARKSLEASRNKHDKL